MQPIVEPGTILQDRYEIVKRIGSGGYSVVWLARDQQHHTSVAVKVFAPNHGLEEDDLDQFRREHELTSSLNDPRLLKSTDYFMLGESPCLVFEYMSGGSLYGKVRREGQLPEAEIAKVIYQVAGALNYLHNHQPRILHNDVKPDNVLINYSGNYILADFGISTNLRSTLMRSSQLKGETMTYRTPERILGHPVSSASDIFSFGVLAYELCAGLVGTDSLPPGQLIAFDSRMPAIDQNRYTRRLQHLVDACLNRNPTDRPTAAKLEQYARHYLENGFWPEIDEYVEPTTPAPTPPPSSGRETIPAPASNPIADFPPPHDPPYPHDPPVTPPPLPERKRQPLAVWLSLAAIILAGLGFGGYKLVNNRNYQAALADAAGLAETQKWAPAHGAYSQALGYRPDDPTATLGQQAMVDTVAGITAVKLPELDGLIEGRKYDQARTLLDELRVLIPLLPEDSLRWREQNIQINGLVDSAAIYTRQNQHARARDLYDQALALRDNATLRDLRDQADRREKEERLRVVNGQLVAAVNSNNLEAVQTALAAGADAKTHHQNGPILLQAIQKNSLPIVKALVGAGANCNDGSGYLRTDNATFGSPAVLAAGLGRMDILRYLIDECGASVNDQEYEPTTRRRTGWSPLGAAAAKGKLNAVEYLLGKNANPNIVQSENRYTPLYEAARDEHNAVAKLLVGRGAQPNTATKDGYTPLMEAAYDRNLELVRFLVQNRADCNQRADNGRRAIDYSRSSEVTTELSRCTTGGGGANTTTTPNNVSSSGSSGGTAYRAASSFDSGCDPFPTTSNDRRRLYCTSGYYYLDGLNASYAHLSEVNFPVNMSRDFAFTAKIELVSGSSADILYGLVFGGNENSDYWFNVNNRGQYTLSVNDAGSWRDLFSYTNTSAISNSASPITFKIEKTGSQLKLYLNGTLVKTLAAPSMYGTRFGFRTQDQCRVRVYDYSLTGTRS